jgi:hypothetical protein
MAMTPEQGVGWERGKCILALIVTVDLFITGGANPTVTSTVQDYWE